MRKRTLDELYKDIGKNVAKYRDEKDMSQLDLSLAMNYKSVSVVSAGEINYRGKHFNLEQLHKISEILDVDFMLLLQPVD